MPDIGGGLGKKARFSSNRIFLAADIENKPQWPRSGVAGNEARPEDRSAGTAEGKTGNFDASSSSVKKNIQAENQASFSQNPKRIVVKNGDTMYAIAYRFFPENMDEGLKKILKVNPKIDDMNLIYKGQN